MENRLLSIYRKDIVAKIKKDFDLSSVMGVPRLQKIVINTGIGKALTNRKFLDSVVNDLSQITGQKPIRTLAKVSVASFKLREGNAIGACVTLRGHRMWDFLDRLVTIALPRVRDFRGLNKNSFDGHGNYNLGIKEQIIFPEIHYDKVDAVRGMDISFVLSGSRDELSKAVLIGLGMPFQS